VKIMARQLRSSSPSADVRFFACRFVNRHARGAPRRAP
jgi:hypothetical protein